jgi:hypothetical protein
MLRYKSSSSPFRESQAFRSDGESGGDIKSWISASGGNVEKNVGDCRGISGISASELGGVKGRVMLGEYCIPAPRYADAARHACDSVENWLRKEN